MQNYFHFKKETAKKKAKARSSLNLNKPHKKSVKKSKQTSKKKRENSWLKLKNFLSKEKQFIEQEKRSFDENKENQQRNSTQAYIIKQEDFITKFKSKTQRNSQRPQKSQDITPKKNNASPKSFNFYFKSNYLRSGFKKTKKKESTSAIFQFNQTARNHSKQSGHKKKIKFKKHSLRLIKPEQIGKKEIKRYEKQIKDQKRKLIVKEQRIQYLEEQLSMNSLNSHIIQSAKLTKRNNILEKINQDLLNQIGNFQSLTISLKTAQKQYLQQIKENQKKEEIIQQLRERRHAQFYSQNNTPRESSKPFFTCTSTPCQHEIQLEKLLSSKMQKIEKIKSLRKQIEQLKESGFETDAFSLSKTTCFDSSKKERDIYQLLSADSQGEAYEEVQRLMEYEKSTKGFLKCMTDMVIKCSPNLYLDKQKPTLKEIWKWVKSILQNYMNVQRQLNQKQSRKVKTERQTTFSPNRVKKGFSFGQNSSFQKD